MAGHPISSVLALLQTQIASPQSGASGLALLAAIVAVVRRKHAIGGWLLYFLFQLFLGLSLVVLTTHWRRFLPSSWGDTGQYFLFAIPTISRTVLMIAIAAISLTAVSTRQWRWVCGLRYALVTYAFLTVVKIAVDVFCFPTNLQIDMLSLAFPCVWIVYFELSRRVRSVFLDKTWVT